MVVMGGNVTLAQRREEGRRGEKGEGWEGGSQQVETTDRHTPLVLKEWMSILKGDKIKLVRDQFATL